MDKRQLIRKSKKLSRLLRHRVEEAGIEMDAAGWVSAAAVMRHLHMDEAELRWVIDNNNKRRFQLEGGRLRACQGHSLDAPVTQEALELSWQVWAGEGALWHTTTYGNIDSIRAEGLSSMSRTHVHLAASEDSLVGKRNSHVNALVEIDPAQIRAVGEQIYQAPNGVILCRWVPPEAIAKVHPFHG
ncbi:RNA 2'-phosphotransferase [Myxococcota bacterium]|nr:RNA 2'-phosphotransferase [Myxococcota bacterium]MBU1431671.1 RNA 2'-phosphotransferase [Myxococcota bacterium]MBU1899254.1 RNA 2'-phosphotransferase [Myxococcota bacterium]